MEDISLQMALTALAALAVREGFGFAYRIFARTKADEQDADIKECLTELRAQIIDRFDMVSDMARQMDEVCRRANDILSSVRTVEGVPTSAILKSIDRTTEKLANIQEKMAGLLEQILRQVQH